MSGKGEGLSADDVEAAQVFGIDRLALSIPLAGRPRSWQSWRACREKPGRRSTIAFAGGITPIYVEVGVASGGGWNAFIDFNPARVISPTGWLPCQASLLREAAEEVWDDISGLVDPASTLGGAKVRRVDVARDFAVAEPAKYVWGLLGLPRTWATILRVHADPGTGGVETLQMGSKAGGEVKVYDKHAQKAAAPEGTLRWEGVCRGWAARHGPIVIVDDLREAHIARLGLDRFQWSRAGTSIAGLPEIVQRLRQASIGEQAMLKTLGQLVMAAYTPLPEQHPTAVRVARDLGIALHPDMLCTHGSEPVRLDLMSGREVSARSDPARDSR